MSDVIRLTKSQKASIEKLIPELLKKYEMRFEDNEFLNMLNEEYTKAINNRDYSYILTSLIVSAARDLKVILND